MINFRPLKADEIMVRVKEVNQYGAVLLLYKTVRADMNILDETVGQMNWYPEYTEIKGNLYCTLYVRESEDKPFIGKQNCGVESARGSDGSEKKAEASDAMKRAGFCWSIGRELYNAPYIIIDLPREEVEKNGKRIWKLKRNPKLTVSEVDFDERRRFQKLVICDRSVPIYTFPNTVVPEEDKRKDTKAEREKLRNQLYALGGGDIPRVVDYAERCYPHISFEDMTVEQLGNIKVKLANRLRAERDDE